MTTVFRKGVHVVFYYLLPLILVLASYFIGGRHFFFELGEWALYALIAVMFIKPLYVLIPWKFLRHVGTYRRELGLLSFWLFFFHGAGLIYLFDLFAGLGRWFDVSGGLFWGGVAAIAMIICGLTSNTFSTQRLGGNWKKVQSFAYLALVATLVHVALANERQDFVLYMVILGIYVVLKIAEFWKSHHEDSEPVVESKVNGT